MNANHKEIIPEATGALGNSTRPARKLVPAAIHPVWRMLLVILALGLITGLGLMLEGRVTAQTFTNLPSFAYSDGAYPNGGLILSGNTLYGTASREGSAGGGTVFAVHTDGTGFTNLHNFTATYLYPFYYYNPYADYYYYYYGYYDPYYVVYVNINPDGADPVAGLILSGNTLYGTAAYGGQGGNGTVFAVNTDGTGFTIVHSF